MGEVTRVALAGYGRLGAELARGLAQSGAVQVVGIVRRSATPGGVRLGETSVPVHTDVTSLLEETRPQVLIEASHPEAALGHVQAALERGVSPIIATSGLSAGDVDRIREDCRAREIGGVIAPNLSLGVVVLVHLATIAARFFDSADIIEMHRDKKADAPSGTALYTARLMAEARQDGFTRAVTSKFTLPEVRGGELGGIGIHSIRLPGLVAHQEVIFGGLGQTLTLRHDTTSNESYVPGVLLAIKHALSTRELTEGLAALLGLGQD